MSIKAKLALAFAGLIVTLVLCSAVAFFGYQKIAAATGHIADLALPRLIRESALRSEVSSFVAEAPNLARAADSGALEDDMLKLDQSLRRIEAQASEGEKADIAAVAKAVSDLHDAKDAYLATEKKMLWGLKSADRTASDIVERFAPRGNAADIEAVESVRRTLQQAAHTEVAESETILSGLQEEAESTIAGLRGVGAEDRTQLSNGSVGPAGVITLARKKTAQAGEVRARLGDLLSAAASLTRNAEKEMKLTADDSRAEVATAGRNIVRARVALAAITLTGLLAALLLAWRLGHRLIARRLAGLVAAMEEVRLGRLEGDIEIRGADEIAVMSRALLVFRDTAREVETARRRADQARAEAQAARERDMAELAERFRDSVLGLVSGVRDAAGAVACSSGAMSEEAGRAISECAGVAAAAGQASMGVVSVADAATQLSASINEIGRQASRSNDIARRAAGESEQMGQAVQALSQAVGRIGEISQSIETIASQTRMLALNAAIEAQRAGESGRGFAVVAGEVKVLAGQTERATEEITEQIAAIGREVTRTAGAIQGVEAVIAEIGIISAIIATAVDEQNAATAEIARNASGAADGVQHVSERILEVRSVADATGTASAGVLSEAERMAEASAQLQRQVERFLEAISGTDSHGGPSDVISWREVA
jgi:methyl-accepting chemotaxis protein